MTNPRQSLKKEIANIFKPYFYQKEISNGKFEEVIELAMEAIKGRVPDKKRQSSTNTEKKFFIAKGHNDCRRQTLKNMGM